MLLLLKCVSWISTRVQSLLSCKTPEPAVSGPGLGWNWDGVILTFSIWLEAWPICPI